MKIRSITVFAAIPPQSDAEQLTGLGAFARLARQAYQDAGFEVQTIRLAADVFPALANSPWAERPADFAAELEGACRAQGFEYVALGPAGEEMLSHLPEVFAATQAIFATAHIVDPGTGAIDGRAIRGAAHVIRQAAHIEDGFGNLRFAALANVPPGTPFFPAAYHGGGAPAFAIATQSADLAVAACQAARDAEDARLRLATAITDEACGLVAVAEKLARSQGLRFGGVDFSLAPFPTAGCSIGAALEALSGRPLGNAGTLTAAATFTDAIDQARFPHTGFCGMMLPVLEDAVLARRAAEGRLRLGELLQWSAVCGTGLDTVPLPGNVSEDAIARLLFDVAALSARLRKPLTARLMPLPGKTAGDPVHFDFAYFADGGVLPLDGEGGQGLLKETQTLSLHPRER
jgi:uncharacterized protein (UPF0210 family)